MARQAPQRRGGPSDRMPEFSNREEMAAWFDTHDTADYEAEFRPVKVRFAKGLSENLNIRLDEAALLQLREQAHQRGIAPSTLARMWIVERLRGETRA